LERVLQANQQSPLLAGEDRARIEHDGIIQDAGDHGRAGLPQAGEK